jgi:hypothetical protein
MSIETMRQALDALDAYSWEQVNVARAALRAAIEQAEKQPAQRQWVGLTEKDFSAINQSCLTKLQAATSAESILKEKNQG